MRLIVLVLSVFLAALSANAADDTKIIFAGKLVDTLLGKVLENQAILVEGERIVDVVDRRTIKVSPEAEIIDLSEYSVLPGLIDAHVHITQARGRDQFKWSAASTAIQGVVNAAELLGYGYTSIRVPGAIGYSDTALRNAINAGLVPGPRIKASGPYVGPTGGCNDPNIKMSASYEVNADHHVDGVAAVRKEIRKHILRGVDSIKTCTSGTVLSGTGGLNMTEWSVDELEALMDEAHMHGLKVAVHTHSASGVKKAIRAGADSIEHGSFLDDEAIAMAVETQTALVMDIYWTDWIQEEGLKNGMSPDMLARDRAVGQAQRDNFRKAHKAGANIVFGTDVGGFPMGLNGRQFKVMVEYGMTPMEAVQAATVRAAKLLGMANDVGSIENGKYADIVAVKGDVLANIALLENVDFVMKGGAVYKAAH